MKLNFDKGNGLVPAIVQDAHSLQVLMLGYMNNEALDKTVAERRVTFYSRSKGRLWTKGETSGNYLQVQNITADCDNDTLLIKANPEGPVCHLGTISCFAGDQVFNLQTLEKIIVDRKQNPKPSSYTSKLFEEGVDKIAQKVGEEAVEVVIAAKNDDREEFLNETADLLYHLGVLIAQKGCSINEIVDVLKSRHQQS